MPSLYRSVVRPALFALDAERSHRLAVIASRFAGSMPMAPALLKACFGRHLPVLRTTVAGLDFPSPVGLAAGFDKNAETCRTMASLGFGFIEIGSVSADPSPGNQYKPRLWRLEPDEALRVHYGCPSDGAERVAARLRGATIDVPLGINVVETNTGTVGSAEQAADEIVRTLASLARFGDYVVLNLSCPNMPRGGCGLFDAPSDLGMLLRQCAQIKDLPPLFLKITPPGDPADPRLIDPVLQTIDPFPFVRGITLNVPNRDPHGSLKSAAAMLNSTRGGITGPSLNAATNAALRAWCARMDRARHILIGCGGIASADDAYTMIRNGASLVQLYTALVYHGPGLVKRINEGLAALLTRDGFRSVGEAVGSSLP